MTTDTPTVEQPKHPLYALTTSELSDQRRQLELAIASCDGMDDLRARLDDVIAEQDDRTRLAAHA